MTQTPEKTYTEQQIRAAFFDQFHEAGELWFPYIPNGVSRREDEVARCAAVTERAFGDFIAALAQQKESA